MFNIRASMTSILSDIAGSIAIDIYIGQTPIELENTFIRLSSSEQIFYTDRKEFSQKRVKRRDNVQIGVVTNDVH